MTYRPESAQEEHDSEMEDQRYRERLAKEQPERYARMLAEAEKAQPKLKLVEK